MNEQRNLAKEAKHKERLFEMKQQGDNPIPQLNPGGTVPGLMR
jgi:hypothetical protein